LVERGKKTRNFIGRGSSIGYPKVKRKILYYNYAI